MSVTPPACTAPTNWIGPTPVNRPPPTAARAPLISTPATATATLITMSVMVTVPRWPAALPPNAVRADRCVRRPSRTHSGHW
jgi:hypothetical protein